MKYHYDPSFIRDVKKITPAIHVDLGNVLEEIKSATLLKDISNVKKLSGFKTAYRIKINNHRLCFFYNNNHELILARFLPRKDVYRYFP